MQKTADAKADPAIDDDAANNDNPAGTHGKDNRSNGSRASAEIGGRKGPDPTRYGDWEKNGRCIDF